MKGSKYSRLSSDLSQDLCRPFLVGCKRDSPAESKAKGFQPLKASIVHYDSKE
jgi:hypothetical protein